MLRPEKDALRPEMDMQTEKKKIKLIIYQAPVTAAKFIQSDNDSTVGNNSSTSSINHSSYAFARSGKMLVLISISIIIVGNKNVLENNKLLLQV